MNAIKPDATKVVVERHAEDFTDQFTVDGRLVLRRWRQDYYRYKSGRWAQVHEEDVQNAMTRSITENHQNVTRTVVSNAMLQVQAKTALMSTTEPHTWLTGRSENPDTSETVCTRNRIVNLASLSDPSYEPIKSTPDFFNLNATEFDFVPREQAGTPTQWLRFVDEVFCDPEQVKTLQQWMGLCLTLDTRQQKMLIIIGAKRSGKGTTARILNKLIGKANVASPTLSSFSERFGLWPLIGKQLAVIPDARIDKPCPQTVERLLSITGEDSLSIDRKNKSIWTGQLKSRIMLLSNELPRFRDASGALASRMIILTTKGSFYGREDHGLEEKLTAELPAIFWWAVDGWRSLRQEGRLHVPASSHQHMKQMERLGSREKAFVEDCCRIEHGSWTSKDALYEAHRRWAEAEGLSQKGKVVFLRDLYAAYFGKLEDGRPTVDGNRLRVVKGIRLNRIGESPSDDIEPEQQTNIAEPKICPTNFGQQLDGTQAEAGLAVESHDSLTARLPF